MRFWTSLRGTVDVVHNFLAPVFARMPSSGGTSVKYNFYSQYQLMSILWTIQITEQIIMINNFSLILSNKNRRFIKRRSFWYIFFLNFIQCNHYSSVYHYWLGFCWSWLGFGCRWVGNWLWFGRTTKPNLTKPMPNLAQPNPTSTEPSPNQTRSSLNQTRT